MKQILLLFLSTDHLHVQLMMNGEISLQLDFSDTAEDREKFASLLQAERCPIFMLTDLIEEDFRHEVVPHLMGNSRTAMLRRKFEQFYRGTPFHQATLLQRQKTGRRDDDMLFSALTNPSYILPWLGIMQHQQAPLAGIYSVPQISAPLVKAHPSDHLLLISWEKYSGLRQTYFSEHRLQISRLTPLHAEMTFNDAVVNELSRTYLYLKSLSLLPVGQILDVRILCHSGDRNDLQQRLPTSSDMRYDLADIEEVGRNLKIDYHFADSDASQIFLHQLALSRPKSHYANAEHTHYFTIWRLRRMLNWGSALILIASLLWAGLNVLQSSGNDTETESLKLQAQGVSREVELATRDLPATTISPEDMKSSVTAVQQIEKYQSLPQSILKPISSFLDHYPQILLIELGWTTSAAEPVAGNTQADVPAKIITLKGHLYGFGDNYRSALNYLDRFQADLVKQGYQVTVLSAPLDTSPTSSLADKRDSGENELDFSLKLAWRPSL